MVPARLDAGEPPNHQCAVTAASRGKVARDARL